MELVAILLTGTIAGFLNVLAGGGSLITLPMLSFVGLPLDIANGTNRIAILMQNLVATNRFQRSGVKVLGLGLKLGLAATVGALVGTQIAVSLEREFLEKVVGSLLLIMAVLLVFRPKMWTEPKARAGNVFLRYGSLAAVGIYGGFIQAGVGFFILLPLILMEGLDLLRANAVKVVIILVYTVPSLILFLINGKVHVGYGIFLGIGNILGAELGARFAVLKGSKWIRVVLLIAVIFGATKYLVS
ncbi:MAG: sulfite exporter TauE/SafE family protein [Thermotogae bacterium]|nr:sulfite exporter TauE/SafE family protein [Thermotogota bacterium]RKX43431.1 MAG: sulfite exporter TauE/SafE family protein [Thermotogota bacterium]